MDEAQFKYELLDVLKDIGEYLAKDGDTKQMTAKLDKPPKIAETQKPLKGAEAPPFKPGKDALVQNSMLAKDFPEAVDEPRENETSTVDCQEGTLLKEDGDLEEYKEEEEEENDNGGFPPERSSRSSSRSSEGEDDFGELKSLLKDIKSALMLSKATSESKSSKTSKTSESSAVSKAIVDEIKKSLPTMINAETHRMLRKMGFSPSRSDVVKFGLDEDIKKSEDSLDEKAKEAGKVVDDLTHKSWAELGRLREATGQFNAFPR